MQNSSGVMEPLCGVAQASQVIGAFVENRRRVRLGRIHYLVIEPTNGRLAYAVLSFGVREGTRLFAVPWSAFEFSATGNRPVLDVDRRKLENAPGFRKDVRWPDFADRTWALDLDQYYGCGPYRDQQERPQADRRPGGRGMLNPTQRARAGAGRPVALQAGS